jgi:hypothetical protein
MRPCDEIVTRIEAAAAACAQTLVAHTRAATCPLESRGTERNLPNCVYFVTIKIMTGGQVLSARNQATIERHHAQPPE